MFIKVLDKMCWWKYYSIWTTPHNGVLIWTKRLCDISRCIYQGLTITPEYCQPLWQHYCFTVQSLYLSLLCWNKGSIMKPSTGLHRKYVLVNRSANICYAVSSTMSRMYLRVDASINRRLIFERDGIFKAYSFSNAQRYADSIHFINLLLIKTFTHWCGTFATQ